MLQELQIGRTSAPLPNFVIHCGTLRHEIRKQRGTGMYMVSGAAFRFEVPEGVRRKCCRNFKSAALVGRRGESGGVERGRML
jgi:hypothetical protein